MTRPLCLAVLLFSFTAAAQRTPQPLSVNPDHSITFRYFDPSARKVAVALDLYDGHPVAMTRDDAGEWTVTTAPLPPEYYGYNFSVDGHTVLDPLNSDVRLNASILADQVLVPGTPPAKWELTDVPHGRVDHLRFTSHIVLGLPAGQSGYVVYTPPGYDPQRKPGYPVLYLLHGWSHTEMDWITVGRADMILDNLLAAHQAVPMIVVMPLGYGDMAFLRNGFSVWGDPVKVAANTSRFEQTLFSEVMPAVEHAYDIAPGRDNRAIAGLSMGGLEALSIGLRHTETFAWVAGMSGAVHGDMVQSLPNLDGKAANLRLLWIGCGLDEPLLQPNRALGAWATAHGFAPVAYEIPGAHVWLTWRDDLVHLAPLLFKSK